MTIEDIKRMEEIVKNDKHHIFYKKSAVIDKHKIEWFNYRVGYYKFFQNNDGEFDPIKLEMRGIAAIYKPNGELDSICYSVPKFFNINQFPEVSIEHFKNAEILHVVRKEDGSMIMPLLINGKLYAKTRGSVDNKQVQMATTLLRSELYANAVKQMISDGFYPLFELVGPDNIIVVPYKENHLRLIMVRNINTGEILLPLEPFGEKYGLPVAPSETNKFKTVEDIIDAQHREEKIEGWVVYLKKGENIHILKFKTDWYLERHQVLNMTPEIIVKAILKERIDDLLSTIPADDPIRERIDDIAEAVETYRAQVTQEIIYILQNLPAGDERSVRKQLALTYKKKPYFSTLMRIYGAYAKGQAITYQNVWQAVTNDMLRQANNPKRLQKLINSMGIDANLIIYRPSGLMFK